MRVVVSGTLFECEVPDGWLAEARLCGFIPASTAYKSSVENGSLEVCTVPISSVLAPINRGARLGGLDKARLMPLLVGMRENVEIPPVKVHRRLADSIWELRDGYHRYVASVVLGFSSLPVLIVPYFDIDTFWQADL
jgi:hypothetical protein